jgi:hypothetical protein
MATHQRRHGIDYYNSGSWIDAKPTYLTIDEEGVRICEYSGAKYEYASEAKSDAEQLRLGEMFDPVSLLEPAFGSYESLRC